MGHEERDAESAKLEKLGWVGLAEALRKADLATRALKEHLDGFAIEEPESQPIEVGSFDLGRVEASRGLNRKQRRARQFGKGKN